jgi:hypothetical protein
LDSIEPNKPKVERVLGTRSGIIDQACNKEKEDSDTKKLIAKLDQFEMGRISLKKNEEIG